MEKILIFKKGKKLWSAFLAKTAFDKTLGLMFKSKAIPLLFEFDGEATTRNSIHSFFCPVFDAVFLDSQKRVVCVFERIQPFKLFITPHKPARFLIELPAGESRKISIGDKLVWNPGEGG